MTRCEVKDIGKSWVLGVRSVPDGSLAQRIGRKTAAQDGEVRDCRTI